MTIDGLLHRYFGTDDISALSSEAMASGIQRCRSDIATENDEKKKFDLWAFLQLLVPTPHSDVTLLDTEYQGAARSYLHFMAIPKEISGT